MQNEMYVKEAIALVKDAKPEVVDLESLSEELKIPGFFSLFDIDFENADTIYEKGFDTWMCTDTIVGKYIIFYKDSPVGVRIQEFRKSSSRYYWFSEKEVSNVREYLKSLMIEDWDVSEQKFINQDTTFKIEGK
jgi:hypothetical protein